MNWRPLHIPVQSIDVANTFIDLITQMRISGNSIPRWHNSHMQGYFSAIFGMQLQQLLKRLQALQDAFTIIEPIYRENYLIAFKGIFDQIGLFNNLFF